MKRKTSFCEFMQRQTCTHTKESCDTNKEHTKSTLKFLKLFVAMEISYEVFFRRGPTGPRFGPQNDKMKQ